MRSHTQYTRGEMRRASVRACVHAHHPPFTRLNDAHKTQSAYIIWTQKGKTLYAQGRRAWAYLLAGTLDWHICICVGLSVAVLFRTARRASSVKTDNDYLRKNRAAADWVHCVCDPLECKRAGRALKGGIEGRVVTVQYKQTDSATRFR